MLILLSPLFSFHSIFTHQDLNLNQSQVISTYDGKLMQDMTYGISYHIQYATNTIITKIHLYGPHHTACQDPVVKE